MIQLDLDKPDAWAVLKTLRLLQSMSWEQLQTSKGLRWELIQSRRGAAGERLFSLRISRSCRAVAWHGFHAPAGLEIKLHRTLGRDPQKSPAE